MLTCQESTLKTNDGKTLLTRHWPSGGPARARLLLVHGFGEHSGRYPTLVEHLVRAQIDVHAFDHRGHGRSTGRRGHISDFSQYRDDVAAMLDSIANRSPALPIFLMGHSMGALIALDYLMHTPNPALKGAILSGTPLEPTGAAGPVLIALSRVMSRYLPAMRVKLGVQPEALSRDSAVVEAYRNDPLVHGLASARWGTEMMDAMRRVNASPQRLNVPTLFVHGGADTVSPPSAVHKFYQRLALKDKMLRVFDGCLHEPHNDPARTEEFPQIAAWIEGHLSS